MTELTSTNIVFLESHRLTDQDDGGGQITATVLPDNTSNALYPGVSNLDAVNGRIILRKIFLALLTSNTAWYYGAGIYISKPPDNPAISALLVKATAFGDTRADIINHMESYLTEGPTTTMVLYGNLVVGQRSFVAYQNPTTPIPEVGSYLLKQDKAGYPAVEQFVRVRSVSDVLVTFTDATGDFERRLLTLSLSEPLDYAFSGVETPSRLSSTTAATKIHTTTVADAARYYGLLPLAQQADADQKTVKVSRILEQLIPSTQADVLLADQPAQALTQQMFACGSARVMASAVVGTVIYLGIGVLPGSVSVTGTQPYTDNADGTLTGSGGQIAQADYVNGVVTFPASGTWTITAQPAAPLTGPAYTTAIPITEATRALSYVITLSPIPAAGVLVVDYCSFHKWYRLADNGAGQLVGADSAYGIGSVNALGTVQLSLQYLPDVGTSIIFSWVFPLVADRRDGTVGIPAPYLAVTLQDAVEPDSLSVTWPSNGVTKTAVDNSVGTLSGDATGHVTLGTGALLVMPAVGAYPDAGSLFTVHYNRRTSYSGVLSGSPVGRQYTLQLPSGEYPIEPGQVAISTTLQASDGSSAGPWTLTETLAWTDDGAGGLVGEGLSASAVDYANGTITLTVAASVTRNRWNAEFGPGYYIQTFGPGPRYLAVTALSFSYRLQKQGDSPVEVTETIAVPDLAIDLTPTTTDAVVPSSARFLLGGAVHVERGGRIYRDVSPTTGLGTAVGSYNHATGVATLTDWHGLTSMTLEVQALATLREAYSTVQLFGRVPGAPVHPGSFQIRATQLDGTAISATVDEAGDFETGDMVGHLDAQTGIYSVRFGERVLDSALTVDQKAEPWYDASLIDGDGKVLVPNPVWPTSLLYNATVYTYTPVDSSLIGINTARLPSDGRVQIIQPGDSGILHHTASVTMPNPLSAGQQVDLGRYPLDLVVLVDATGAQVPTTKWSAALGTGIVTMANPLDLSAYVQPLTAYHTIREMVKIQDVDIAGNVKLPINLVKTFPVGSYLSTLLTAGDRYARYADLRVIQSWQGSFASDGALAAVAYNDVDFPLIVTNEGTIEEDWAVVVESGNSTVKVIGDRVGQIASGLSMSALIAPTSALTGLRYFAIPAAGWGGGFTYGMALRFRTVAASYPVWEVRCTQLHQWTGAGDAFEFQSIGGTPV